MRKNIQIVYGLFFSDVIKYGKLKGYIFLDLKEHLVSETNPAQECIIFKGYPQSSISKPFLDNPHSLTYGDNSINTAICNSRISGIVFPVNYVLFSEENELLEAFFPQILFHPDGNYYSNRFRYDKEKLLNYFFHSRQNGYIKMNDRITNGLDPSPFNIVYSDICKGLKYDNTIVQITLLKDYFINSLSREKLNIDNLEILKTDTILYHIEHHLFKKSNLKSFSPKESTSIYFEISW